MLTFILTDTLIFYPANGDGRVKRTKVMFLITRMVRGGAQNYALSIYRSLNREKFEVVFATGPSEGPEGDYLSDIKDSGLSYVVIPSLTREINPVEDIKALFEICELMRKIRPDIVHTHTSKAGGLGRIAARILKVPITIHQPHGLAVGELWGVLDVPQSPFIRRSLLILEKILAKTTDRFIAYTNIETEEHLRYGIGKREQFVTIPYGIDLKGFYDNIDGVKWESQEDRSPKIGTVGRLVTSKGCRYLIEATALVKRSFPDIKLFIAGGGFLRNDLEDLAKKLGLTNNVRFLGVKDDVAKFLRNIDIFISPTLYESFGITLIEAQACRKPVVASDVGSVPEIIKNGETGILVPPRDADAIAEAVIRLIRDKELAKKLGEAGFESVRENYTIEKTMEKIERLYADCYAKL